ncbi:MAG: hypothetical protein JWQ51_3410, partial [Tardiphaga sp.]|nr:hypothetical protein [Tardiphaga sp.]
ALGQADLKRNVAVDITYSPTTAPPKPPIKDAINETTNSRFIYGYSAGVCMDMMLMSNLFLRGEWEYLRFTSPVDVTINTVRAGIGYKF